MLHFICRSSVRGAASNPVSQRGFVCRIPEKKSRQGVDSLTVWSLLNSLLTRLLFSWFASGARFFLHILPETSAVAASGHRRWLRVNHPVTQRCQTSSTSGHRDADWVNLCTCSGYRSKQALGLSNSTSWSAQSNFMLKRKQKCPHSTAMAWNNRTRIKMSSWKKPQQKCRWMATSNPKTYPFRGEVYRS